MRGLQKVIIGKGETTEHKNFVWNMIGSSIFAAMSMILSFFVIRVMGENQGGIFAIAITISQMMAFIAYYETRTYQVTDVNQTYQFGEYKATKLVLCIIMMIACVFYMWFREGTFGEKTAVILLMCVYRMIDGYADLYEGTFQQDGKLYLTGKSQAFRTILSSGALMISLIITHQLILSILIAIIAAIIGLYMFDVSIMKYFREIKPVFLWRKNIEIVKECFPLFVGSFLWTYILSASRIAIDSNMANNYQSYYQTLFIPISVINLCATFVMKPVLPSLAESYNDKRMDDFYKIILKIVFLILGFTVLCMLGAYLIGIPILSLLSGCNLEIYKKVLVFLMLSGGINSLSYLMYYVLTVMRFRAGIFMGYVSAAILANVISNWFVKRSGIAGAATSFFVTVVYLLIFFLVCFWIKVFQYTRRG